MIDLDFTVKRLGKPTIGSPLRHITFEREDACVIHNSDPVELEAYYKSTGKIPSMLRAGPREKIYHDPNWTRAAIVTAGGLCPGLNNVIKGITNTLRARYRVPVVYGIQYGYKGLIPSFGFEPVILTEAFVDRIHEGGGTILGSSRGRQDEASIVETLQRMNINILFCVGGDGTLRCAHDICTEIERRGLKINVVGIPKTIDNDISFIDKTFGFETAVYATGPVIEAAHNEAMGAYNGLGLIHVMGRDSGFIAAYATLANSHVNYCLVPEEIFNLEEGDNALLPSLWKRMEWRHHAVIVVAEGAGQYFFQGAGSKDASGNVIHSNIGLFLKDKITDYFKNEGLELNLKYFDPSYLIRSLPAEGTDSVFCMELAQNAVHAAMSGLTDIVVGHWNDRFTYVPIPLATSMRKKIDITGSLWRSVESITWPTYD